MGPPSGYYLGGHMHIRAIWDQAGSLSPFGFRPTLPTEATQWPAGSGFPYYVEQSPLLVYGDGMETGGDHCRRLLGRYVGPVLPPTPLDRLLRWITGIPMSWSAAVPLPPLMLAPANSPISSARAANSQRSKGGIQRRDVPQFGGRRLRAPSWCHFRDGSTVDDALAHTT